MASSFSSIGAGPRFRLPGAAREPTPEIPPTILAFVQFGPGWALLVAGGLLALEQVTGNFLDPRLQGRSLNVSSLVVLLSVILWGWIWGVPGALIAVPLTVTIILVCANVALLRPIAVLLSGGEDVRGADAFQGE